MDERVEDLISRIVMRFDEDVSQTDRWACSHAQHSFALDLLQPVQMELPAQVQASVTTAERHWKGDGSVEELTSARVRAWHCLDGRSSDFGDREVNLVRLAICALYPAWETGHLDLTLLAAVDFADAVGVGPSVAHASLCKRFRDLLSEPPET